MTISVIIPSYNRAATLARAIDSALNQNLGADEIIVVDDGSTDNTAVLITEKYPDLHYVYQLNQGVSKARNTGIKLAKGEWLAFLDSDDEWLPDKLLQQVLALAKTEGYRLIHTDEIWIRNGVRVNPMKKHAKYGGHIFQHCLPLCCISPSAVMIHRSLFDEIGLFDENLPACEDYDLWLRICCENPVLFVDQKLIKKYGGHADQLSTKHWGMDRFRIQALENILLSDRLTDKQSKLTVNMLSEKINIMLMGANKRHNTELVREYRAKLQRLQNYS